MVTKSLGTLGGTGLGPQLRRCYSTRVQAFLDSRTGLCSSRLRLRQEVKLNIQLHVSKRARMSGQEWTVRSSRVMAWRPWNAKEGELRGEPKNDGTQGLQA